MSDEFISVRLARIPNMRELQAAAAHASRLDKTSIKRLRPGADSSLNYHHRPWIGAPRPGAVPIDYVADFETMLRRRGIPVRANAAPVAHCIVQVSPAWIKRTGELHDPENPRNRQFFEFSIAFARHAFGEDSVLAARMDHDETGGGTVDVFVCAEARTKTGKPFLSISPALRRIQKGRPEARNTFSALQDCVAEYAKATLDANLKRGKLKEGRAPDRLTPENYAARAINERRRRRLEVVRAGVKTQHKQIKADRQALLDREDELDRRAAEIERREQELLARETALDERLAALEAREYELIVRTADLDARETASVVGQEAIFAAGQIQREQQVALASAELAISLREEALGRREVAFGEERAIFETRLSDATRQEQEAERLLQTVRDLERQATEKADALAPREKEIETREAESAAEAERLEALRQKLDEQTEAVAAQEAQAHEQMTRNDERQAELDRREVALAARDEALGKREATVQAREDELGRRGVALDLRDKAVGAREQAATDLAKAVADRDAEVRGREKKLGQDRLAFVEEVAAQHDAETAFKNERANFELERQGAFDKAKADGVAAADVEIEREFERSKATGVALGREQGRNDVGALRAIPLETVAELLGGGIDGEDVLLLPNLGRVLLPNPVKRHRYRIEKTGTTGGGALDLVMAETGWDYHAALQFLRTEHASEAIAADKANVIADAMFTEIMEAIKAMPDVGLEDRAPAAPEHRDALKAALVEDGVDADLVQSAIAGKALEATMQGTRLLARWTLRDADLAAVGYRLEPMDGGRAFVRGSNGWCRFNADPDFGVLPEDEAFPPQYWVAATPRDAMAAISVLRNLNIPALAPQGSAKAVACERPTEAMLTAIADDALRNQADVVLCQPATSKGLETAQTLGKILKSRNVPSKTTRQLLDAFHASDWASLARAVKEKGHSVLTALRNAYARLRGGQAPAGRGGLGDT